MKISRETADYAVLGFFIVLLFSLFTGLFSSQVGYTLVVIDNPDPNSMWPTYFQGDLFLIHKVDPQDIHIGDVVVYQKPGQQVKVIHRVIDVIIHNGDYYYRVKGDNFVTNQSPDEPGGSTLISHADIVGKTVARLPYLGHLSLAMQRNRGVQILVFSLAAIAVAAILLWPSDEEEETDPYIHLNRAIFASWVKGIFSKPTNALRNIRVSKDRNLKLVLGFVIIAILIIPIFAAGWLNGDSNEIGVTSISPGPYSLMSETLDGNNYTSHFIQLKVELVDNAGSWKRIQNYEIEVFSDNNYQNRISFTKWTSFKDFEGRVIIGSAIVIPDNLQPANGSTIYVKITLDIATAFFFHSSEEFTDDFVYLTSY